MTLITAHIIHSKKLFYMGKKSKRKSKTDTPSPQKPPTVFPATKLDWRPLVVIFFITCAAYYPAIHAGFIWDDDFYVTENHLLTAPDGLRRIWFTTESPSQYFPLTYSLFMIERRLWDLNPMGYHLVNIALHALNAVLVFLLFTRLKLRWAWMAAAIFALHPVHVESVAWVTELKNTLSGMFYLFALLSYLRFEDNQHWRWYAQAFVLFAMALLSKTVVLTLPLVILLVGWWRRGRITWRETNLLLPFMALGLAMGLLSSWWEINQQGTTGEVFDFSFFQRVLLSGRALCFYVLKLLWPVNLTFSYPQWTLNPLALGQYGWHLGLVLLLFVLWQWRKIWGRGPLTGVAIFMVTLAPMLGFVNYYTMRYSFVADHYQYLASLGLIAVLVDGIRWGFEGWRTRANDIAAGRLRKAEGFIGLIVLLLLGVLTWQQAYAYRDSETLWKDTLKKNPRSWMAYNNLGIIVTKQGNLNQGVEYFKKALTINPVHLEAYNNLGAAYTKQGRLTDAIPVYERALAIKPNHPKTLNNLGIVYAKTERIDDAIHEYRKALSVSPRYIEAHYNLGNAFLKKGSFEDAIAAYKLVLALQPLHAETLVNLGAAYLNQNSLDQALLHLKKALAINPTLVNAHINLAYVHYLQGNYRLAAQECENIRKLGYTIPRDLLEAMGPYLAEGNL